MKVAIVSSNLNFAGGLINELDRRGAEVIVYQHTDSDARNAYQLGQIRDCEVAFVDFVQTPIEAVLDQFPGRIVVRAHRIEMYSEGIDKLPWSKVANLCFIADHVRSRFMERLTGERPQQVTLLPHVGVDLDTFAFVERDFEPPYHILVAGNQIPKKRVYTALQMLHDLPDCWRMTLVGSGGMPGYGNAEYVQNCMDYIESMPGLRDRLSVHGQVPHEELTRIMASCTHVLSASNEEGCHTTIAEGMATGLVPLIGNWRGSDAIYPPEWVWRSPLEFYGLCTDWEAREDKLQLSQWCANYAADRFDAKLCNGLLADIIMGSAGGQEEWYNQHLQHQIAQYGNQRQQRCFRILRAYSQPGERLLDVGCGVGYVTSTAANAGWHAWGIDLAPNLIARAQYTAGDGAQFAVCDVRSQWPDGEWDVVSLFDSLEHVPTDARQGLLLNCYNALAPGGRLILTYPWGRGDSTQPHEWPVYPKTVMAWLREVGFQVVANGALDEEYWHTVMRKDGDPAGVVVQEAGEAPCE